MSNATNDLLLDTVKETITWATELEEEFTSTTAGKIITSQKQSLIEAIDNKDLESARVLMLALAQTCDRIDEINEH